LSKDAESALKFNLKDLISCTGQVTVNTCHRHRCTSDVQLALAQRECQVMVGKLSIEIEGNCEGWVVGDK